MFFKHLSLLKLNIYGNVSWHHTVTVILSFRLFVFVILSCMCFFLSKPLLLSCYVDIRFDCISGFCQRIGRKMYFFLLCVSRTSCRATCWGSLRTVTVGRNSGWSSPTSASSSTSHTRLVIKHSKLCILVLLYRNFSVFVARLSAGRLPSGQPSSAGLLCHRPIWVRKHPQRLRLQTPL